MALHNPRISIMPRWHVARSVAVFQYIFQGVSGGFGYAQIPQSRTCDPSQAGFEFWVLGFECLRATGERDREVLGFEFWHFAASQVRLGVSVSASPKCLPGGLRPKSLSHIEKQP